ncbi:putative DNA-binding protein REB1 [Glarea lozoyensis 74030]|uniref:Putative DNA-binding protein REB1 n=1 Tax=Glarea lozoyensis (strain ATCC 74030 / MF5533) TaxID=1104152 RepID=H0EJA5_GLAL7|nr:putative DNA-binding protein REB1 [Glarea lozoyensis 74030]
MDYIKGLIWSSQPARKEEGEEVVDEARRSSPPLSSTAIEEEHQPAMEADATVEIQTAKDKKKRKRKRKSSSVTDVVDVVEDNDTNRGGLQLEESFQINGIENDLDRNSGMVVEEEEQAMPNRSEKRKKARNSKTKADEEQLADSLPARAKKTRKSKGKSVVEAPPELPRDVETSDMVAEGLEPQTASREELGDSSTSTEPKKPNKVLRQEVSVVIPAPTPEKNSVMESGERASAKSAKAKKKKSKTVLSEDRVHKDNEVEVAEHPVQEHEPEMETNDTPPHASTKALGKRKASDSVPNTTTKPKRTRKSKDSPGTSLLELGFSKEKSGSQMDTENLVQTAKELYLKSTMEIPETSPILPPGSKGKRKSKAKSPIVISASKSTATPSRQQRRATPQFTPVNRKSTNEPSQSLVENDTALSADAQAAQEEPSVQTQPSPPKSNQKRKRRLLVDSQEREDGPNTPQGAFSTPATGSKLIKDDGTPKDSKHNGQVRKGKFAPRELEAIDVAVETYREMHDLTQFKVNEIIQAPNTSEETKELWTSIRDVVPDIPHRRVYDTCRRRFHNFESRGSWTKEQDEELKDAYARFPQKWKQIGELINRFPEDARDRWRNYLICGDNLRKDYWEKEEEDRLREVVSECVEILRRAQRTARKPDIGRDALESLLDWQIVSQKMNGVRSRLQCSSKWRQLKDREDSNDEGLEAITTTEWRAEEADREARAMSGAEILQLLVTIRDSGAGKESKIPWLIVTEAVEKLGKRMALKFCFRKLRRRVPGGKDMRFREIVDTLIAEFEASQPDIPQHYIDTEFVRPVKRKSQDFVENSFHAEGSRKKRRRATQAEDDRRVKADLSNQALEISQDEQGVDRGKQSSKKKTKSKPGVELSRDEEQNGTSEQVPTRQRRRKSRNQASFTARDDEQPQTPKPKKRKKLRDSMKRQDESQSQEAIGENGHNESAEDISEIMQSLKKGPKLRKNKRKDLGEILGEETADRRNRDSVNHVDETQQGNQSASQFSDQEEPPEIDKIGNSRSKSAQSMIDNDESDIHEHHRQIEANHSEDENFDNTLDPEDADEAVNEPSNDDRGFRIEDPEVPEEFGDNNPQTVANTTLQQSEDEAANDTAQDGDLPEVGIEDIDQAPAQPSDEEDLEGDQGVGVAYDENELDPDDGVVYGSSKASPYPSSDEEENRTPSRAGSIDLDTMTPVVRTRTTSLNARSSSVPSSPSSHSGGDPDLGSVNDESAEETQAVDEQSRTLDHSLGQFGEEEEIDDDYDIEPEHQPGEYEGLGQPSNNGYEHVHNVGYENGEIDESSEEMEAVAHTRDTSPDLDTPIRHDGRRNFRTRAKVINYDDTAHLHADVDESDASQDLLPKSRRSKTTFKGKPDVENHVETTASSVERSGKDEPEKTGWEASDLPEPSRKKKKARAND